MFAEDVRDVTESVKMLGGSETSKAEAIIAKITKAVRKNADFTAILGKMIVA